MTLIEHLRGWDEMPEDDSEAFRWLDLKTAEAADELEFLQQQLVDARRTAEYWKANHLAGNEQLAYCQAALADTEALEIGTGERLEKVEQQLAAAIAACKLKDVTLESAHNGLRWWMDAFPLHVTEADNEEMLKLVKTLSTTPDQALEQFAAKVREAQIDAERYRWLRNALTDRSKNGVSHHFCSISSGHPEELDDSIDAAIAATPKGEVK